MILINEDRINKLKNILANYPKIISDEESGDLILKVFTFEKPLTSIEFYNKDFPEVMKFIAELEEFFFTGHIKFPKLKDPEFSGLIFISRFRNLFNIAINYANEYNGMLDEFADLSGILYGYSPEEIAEYCKKDRLKKFNLIK